MAPHAQPSHAAATTIANANTAAAPLDQPDGEGGHSASGPTDDRPVGPCPGAFLRLLQSDPTLCAAVMRLAQRHAPHLLRALAANSNEPQPSQQQPQPTAKAAVNGPTVAAALTAAVDSSVQPPPVQAESKKAKLVRLGRLRDQALVTDTIAIVLSFLPARERLPLGRVGRDWRSAVQQPALWTNAGWRFGDLSEECAPSAIDDHCVKCTLSLVPSWLRPRLSRVECFSSQLLHRKPLAALSSFTAVRHLDVGRAHSYGAYAPSASAEDIRLALQPLRLRSLGVEALHPYTELPLVTALLGLSGSNQGGATDSAIDPVSTPLLSLWAQTLTELKVSFSAARNDCLMVSVSSLHWPALRSLSLKFPAICDWRIAPGASIMLPTLLMRERMPQLQTLRIGETCGGYAIAESALLCVLPMLSNTLTELDLNFELGRTEVRADDWLSGLHLLPSLRVLRCSLHRKLNPSFIRSIALAPKLEVLQLRPVFGAPAVCEQLRLRCEAVSGDGSDGGGNGVGSGLGADRVVLRELHLSDCHLGEAEMRTLALLPHLELLDCRISVCSLGMLSELLQLRSLRLSFGDDCNDAAVQQLSRLHLPHLKSLTLDLAGSSHTATVLDGMRHLLEIPSLTRLQLPWLSRDQTALLRLIHRASNRRGLFIDTVTPLIPSSSSVGLFGV